MTDIVIVMTTVPAGDAGETIAQVLVEERLAACVTLSAPVVSVYRWQGATTRDEERQVLIKTRRTRVPALRDRLEQLHPYAVPEFVVCSVEDGSPMYLDWVSESVGR
jgi:periplasmic divalent cation tolerance protein